MLPARSSSSDPDWKTLSRFLVIVAVAVDAGVPRGVGEVDGVSDAPLELVALVDGELLSDGDMEANVRVGDGVTPQPGGYVTFHRSAKLPVVP